MATYGTPIVAGPNLLPSTAEVFNASKSGGYGAGEYVYHDGKLYKFTAAHTGAWTGTDVEQVKLADEITALNEDLDAFKETVDEEYARIDGYYDELTAGTAEQLISTVYVEDSVPYNFRTSGGSADVGNRETDKLIGGTVGWNQLIKNGNFANTSDWDSTHTLVLTSASDGVGTFVLNSTGATIARTGVQIQTYKDHKYFLSADVKPARTAPIGFSFGGWVYTSALTANAWNHIDLIRNNASSENHNDWMFGIDPSQNSWAVNDTIEVKNVICVDLTQMFGTTVANYIYSIETAEAGAGVAFFRNLFPKPYYAYDAGSVQSVNALSHDTVGFNQWDEEWERGALNDQNGQNAGALYDIRSKNYIPVAPNTKYYIKTPIGVNILVCGYDKNNGYIGYLRYSSGNGTFTTAKNGVNAHYIRFCSYGSTYPGSYANDICINLSWSGYRNGEYEPYDGHTYALDPDLELRGQYALNADNELYCDGDEYSSDGTVVRKYGKYVFTGNETWTKYTAWNHDHTYMTKAGGAFADAKHSGVLVAGKLRNGAAQNDTLSELYPSMWMRGDNDTLYVYDPSFNSASDVKNMFPNGSALVYELTANASETADPYQNPQIVNDFGTEGYADALVEAGTRDVAIPVGHVTQYQANLRDKLQHLPDLADDDGTYLISQSGTDMVLEAFNKTAEEITYNSATAYTDGTVGAELGKKANVDGYYDTLTAGNAEQLIATVGVEDKVPYLFRTSGGSADIGDREVDEIIGGTIAWNQKMNITTDYTVTSNGVTNVRSGTNKTLTITGTSTARANLGSIPITSGTVIKDHIYYIVCGVGDYTTTMHVNWDLNSVETANYKGEQIIKAVGTNAYNSITVEVMGAGKAFPEGGITFYPQLIDLTQAFGKTIADYIYSLETANIGAGVAWFKKLFPKPYYAYDAGTLMSVKTSAHKTVGFNAWDEEWEVGAYDTLTGEKVVNANSIRVKNLIRVIPGATYYKKSPSPGFYWHVYYDANKNYVGRAGTNYNTTFAIPNNAYYMSTYSESGYGTTYKNDICINLSWDGERDGEYESYVEHIYALDSDLELRGIPKLDADNALYYDGDIYKSDGTVTRKYGYVDLGSFTWTKEGDAGKVRTTTAPTNIKVSGRTNATTPPCLINSKNYVVKPYYTTGGGADAFTTDKSISIQYSDTPKKIFIYDSTFASMTADEIKTALTGQYILYELATDTSEEADPYTNPQIVDDFGTEEYVDTRDVPIPVGHSTQYQANLRAKLEMAPNSPSGDGDYIVRQVSGVNTYVPITFPADELPAAPTTDGSYVLKVTVADGTATYSWESAT